MREMVTSAIVLRSLPRGGDRVADLLTLAAGRLEARMVAGRALTSKFPPHVDPLNLITVRLVKKTRYTIADALTESRFTPLRRAPRALSSALEALFALRTLVPKEEPDPRLFHGVRRALARGHFSVPEALVLLGYDPRAARCARCRAGAVAYFVVREGSFLCRECFSRGADGVVLRVIPYGT